MLKVGLTGGIGSGKSTVGYLFSLINIPVYEADTRAKKMMAEDDALKGNIRKLLGERAYKSDGSLNRNYMAQRVFSDSDLLKKLNALVHPAVGRDVSNWFSKQQNVPYAVEEAALLIETGSFKNLDRMIVVTAPAELRIERICSRDGVEESQVRARMNKQADEQALLEHADFVIDNDGKHLLVPQVVAIDKALRKDIPEISPYE